MRIWGLATIALCGLNFSCVTLADTLASAADAKWFQIQTPNFTIYSSGRLDQARRLALKLEQFREAYATLAGTKAVASVPVIVMAFLNKESFGPFKPQYQGQPMNVDGYFQEDVDENLIALNLEATENGSMEVIYHEYAHLLMRNVNRRWPIWLNEGIADVYSTFAIQGNLVCLGAAKTRHVEVLAHNPMMPLRELFEVDHDSPQYNERSRPGVFYAQSWALTHYLVLGNPARKAQYQVFIKRLSEGARPMTAFAESFGTSAAGMEKEVKAYLSRNQFQPVCYNLRRSVETAKPLAAAELPRAEVLFQLGNLFLHTKRLDEAETYFNEAKRVAPLSPRSYEGLGLLAARRKNRTEATVNFEQAMTLRSLNFRVYSEYARVNMSTADGRITPSNLPKETTAQLRASLNRSIRLMPLYAPSHYFLGILEADGNAQRAAHHVRTAIELDPNEKQFSLFLAQVMMNNRDYTGARRALDSLTAPDIDPKIRNKAEAMLQALTSATRSRR